MPREDAVLRKRLEEATYMDLFLRLDRKQIDQMWDGGRAREPLQAIVDDPAAMPKARFLAAEILFCKLPGYPPAELALILAGIYAAALRDNVSGLANPWGLPADLDGEIAHHVLSLGYTAIPAFAPLLDDTQPVSYGGSKEATLGNSFHFRVKDIAASLIAGILKRPFVPDTDPAVRDQAIREVQQASEKWMNQARS